MLLPLLTALIALSISNPPSDCPPLPDLRRPWALGPGEMLAFDLDALGARAGKMTVRVLPQKDGQLPIQAEAETNTFFSKVRRVKGTATSYLNPKSLRPARYVEDALENGIRKTAEVDFRAKDHSVKVSYKTAERAEQAQFPYPNIRLNPPAAIFLFRHLPS